MPLKPEDYVALGITEADRDADRKIFSVWGHKIPDLEQDLVRYSARLESIEEALRVDGVLTAKQLERYYGATPDDLDHFFKATHLVEPVHMRSTMVEATFVGLSPEAVGRRPTVLAHETGAAQPRLQYRIPAKQWGIPASRGEEDEIIPDRVYLPQPGVRIAVEYDRGTYSAKKVVKKLTEFSSHYTGTLWVIPTPAITQGNAPYVRNRRAYLQRLVANRPELQEVKSSIFFVLAKWWRDEKVIRP